MTNHPVETVSKPRKAKIQLERKLFFKKILTFLSFFLRFGEGRQKFWVLGRFVGWQILGFGVGDFGGFISGMRRLSIGLVSVLPMGREWRRAFLPKQFLAETVSSLAF